MTAPGAPGDPRRTRFWRKLRDRVVAEEPHCTLQLAGCTGDSQTADHILTVKDRPDLALARTNLRGACTSCNRNRGGMRDEDITKQPRPSVLSVFD